MAGIHAPRVHVLSDDKTEDLTFGPAKPRGTMSKEKSTKARPTGGSPAARRAIRVAKKKNGKDADRVASPDETRTRHILSSPKQTSVYHRSLGRESLKKLSPGELLKKMNKRLLGRSQTPILKNTQLTSTLAPTGSSSVWMPKNTRLESSSNIATTRANGATVVPPSPNDPQVSSFVGAGASMTKYKELPAKMVPFDDPKSRLVQKKRRLDAQPRQGSHLPSYSQESGAPEKSASEPRYELRKRKK